MLRSWRVWLGFALSLLFIAAFLWGYDLEELWRELRTADYVYVVPALAVYSLALIIRGYRWRTLLSPIKPVSVWLVSGVMLVGYMANNLLPVRTGEVVRAYMVGRKENISKVGTLSTVLLERIFDVLTLSLFLVIGALVVGVNEYVRGLIFVMLAALAVVTCGLAFLAMRKDTAHGLARWLATRLPRRLQDRAARYAAEFLDGFDSIRIPRTLGLAFILTLGTWLAEATTYYVLALAFDTHLGFGHFLLVTAAANLAISVPSSQAGIGPFEFFARQVLVFAGVAEATAAAYVVALHAVLILSTTAAGMVALWALNVSWGQIMRRDTARVAEVIAE